MESLDDDDGYGFEFRFHNIKNSLHKELKPKKAFYQVPKIMTTYFILSYISQFFINLFK
jgi:hypothetical protein